MRNGIMISEFVCKVTLAHVVSAGAAWHSRVNSVTSAGGFANHYPSVSANVSTARSSVTEEDPATYSTP